MTLNNTDENEAIPLSSRPVPAQVEYRLKTFHFSLNLLTHILIGFVVGGALIFVFRNGLPIEATPLHIVLCVLGYQLLIAEAILSLSPFNGWSAHLNLVDKRRAHGILLILGSGLAIAGSFIKILDRTVHWDTLHGRFALVALVFTTVSMVNGLTSLWALEIRRRIPIPVNLVKMTHICFGIVAFTASTITLCHGIDKSLFRVFAGDGIANTLIGFAACYTTIIIINPLISFVTKIKNN